MKNIIAILLLTIGVGAMAQTNAPQTVVPITTGTNFFITAVQWFGTDTSNRWNAAHGYIQAGTCYENQVNIGFSVEAGIHLKSLSTNSAIGLAAENVSSTIGGPSTLIDAEVTYVYDVKDVQLQAGVGPLEDFNTRRTGADIMAEIQKKTGASTHLFARADEVIGDAKGSGHVPRVTAGFGGSF